MWNFATPYYSNHYIKVAENDYCDSQSETLRRIILAALKAKNERQPKIPEYCGTIPDFKVYYWDVLSHEEKFLYLDEKGQCTEKEIKNADFCEKNGIPLIYTHGLSMRMSENITSHGITKKVKNILQCSVPLEHYFNPEKEKHIFEKYKKTFIERIFYPHFFIKNNITKKERPILLENEPLRLFLNNFKPLSGGIENSIALVTNGYCCIGLNYNDYLQGYYNENFINQLVYPTIAAYFWVSLIDFEETPAGYFTHRISRRREPFYFIKERLKEFNLDSHGGTQQQDEYYWVLKKANNGDFINKLINSVLNSKRKCYATN